MHNFDTAMRLAAIWQDELLRTAARQRLARTVRSGRARSKARTDGARA